MADETRLKSVPGKVVHVGVMGDSITADGNYVRELNRLSQEHGMPYRFHAHGVKGNNTAQMLGRFKKDMLANKYGEVIILGGVNDIAAHVPLVRTRGNIVAMCSLAKDAGIRVTVVAVLPWAGYRTSSPARRRQTAELNSWILGTLPGIRTADGRPLADRVVDAWPLLEGRAGSRGSGGLKPAYAGDGLHPSVAGHKRLAQAIGEQAFGIGRGVAAVPARKRRPAALAAQY